ncbi:MAG: peptide-methionine (S)-S-oxide reductase MsrA [Candidatus Liptonbacteria bacterium]|nr:peptide-methionine (S)-S-oxide reductase MsrA [Candidatus Liptonbacteria bacterium]
MSRKEVAIFGGGCFWCTEAVFQSLKGVISVLPGYAGGLPADGKLSTYEEVCSGRTGHAEVIKIEFDPELIKYETLLTVFFATHDPSTPNRQGNDVGEQYRSTILYSTEEQREEAEKFIEELEKSSKEGGEIVTEVKPLKEFYEAEDYHKNYYKRNSSAPYCQVVINPKLQKVQEKFAELLKKS